MIVACYEKINNDSKKKTNASKRHELKIVIVEFEKIKSNQFKSQQSARFADFDKIFEKNLKNAFL